jgi:penicillin-binding protein 1A
VLFLFGLVLFTGLAGAIWVITQIPLPSEAPLAYTTIIYDADGNPLAELHGVENRYPVTIDQIPTVLQDAVIAAEDRNFLRHRGIDPWGILRATWHDLRSDGPTQGGSTITQQYVKNQVVGSDRTLVRKLKEAVVAIKLERKYDKVTILEKYLNTVYFGRGAYGVQAASKTYFGKDVSQLDLKESAYLAGLIRIPSSGDVFTSPEDAYFLRSSVLQAMVANRFITQADADAVEAVPLESYVFVPAAPDTVFLNAQHGTEYFVEYVRQQLVAAYGEDRVLRGGLRVETSLDPKLQALAYDAVYGTLDREDDPDGALVALDREGRVVAMVGGRRWSESKVNLAVGEEGGGGGRQGGSAFKPFVLAEALRQGWKLSDGLSGPAMMTFQPPDVTEEWEVSNYEKGAFGWVSLLDATAYSVNTVYAQLVLRVGPANVARLANEMGIRSELAAVPSIALGTQDVSVLDMTNAYLTLANDGVRLDTRVIRRVSDGGSVLVDDRPKGNERVLDRQVAQDVRTALGRVVDRGSGTRAKLPGPAWGKTGTTEEYGDAWFVGGNDQLVVGVWMGYREGQSRKLTNVRGIRVAGGTFPAAIFHRFMLQAAPGDGTAHTVPPIDPRSFPPQTPTTAAPPSTTAPDPSPTTSTTAPGGPGGPDPAGPAPVVTLPSANPTTTSPPATSPPVTPRVTIPQSPTTTDFVVPTTRPRPTLPDFP